MDYEKDLALLRTKSRYMDPRKVLRELIKVIGYHPDALTIYSDLKLIDLDMVKSFREKGVSGRLVADKVLKNLEIKTPNSQELSIKIFGYYKKITPATLDGYIDYVADRVQLQKEIATNQRRLQQKELDDLIQEEESTLGEIEEFY
ncbi:MULTISPECIES: hypothetical protein [unclassified Breznakia]|uniref:hypothetical protein n=1 Tax=unclassified Breznakia TaxID=2623764 RepID=UPI002475BC5C|nr:MULTISPECIES: hypothetical protein [unclassified Breznakia]MDH6367378.1 hypothetical protein [Breznakia sp. PH1-1]MDH6403910.1 hypothetical protein [Breznakia sp. PF1-11]MDH6411619.1 hypothetical protein [Breznakia sp. PFB1-11]MDH6414545.1 hypothetical protein [Breznakia sp. PFB1-14]MDH6418651.1 hypothetical protein [Breznakia sp. PFB1-12]